MSLIVSRPPFILLWLSFFHFELWITTAADPDRSPLLLLFLCFQDTIVFLFKLFFVFFSRAFFEGPLLMQFPVILLALSLNLNWLRWSRLGPAPRPRLPKPACDINGALYKRLLPMNSLLACVQPPLDAPFSNSLCGQTVRVNCLWQVVNQCEKQKGWGGRW